MKRPFALLGGSAFAFLILAAATGAGTARFLLPLCAGLGLCALVLLAAGRLWREKLCQKFERLSGFFRPGAFFVLLSLSCSLLMGALCLFHYVRAWETMVEPAESLAGVEARIRGTVLDYPEQTYHKNYYTVEVRRILVNGKARDVQPFRIQLSTWSPFSCRPYDSLECTVTFSLPDASGGLYNARNRYLADGVGMTAYLSDYEDCAVVPSAASPPGKLLAEFRHILGRMFEKRLPTEEAGLIRAILLGERDKVSDRAYWSFKKIGASHLLVISGLHMSAIAFFLSLLFSRLPLGRVGRNLLTAGAILCFLALIAFPPSAVRGGVMYLIALTAGCFGRETDSLNSLGAAVLVICLANPFSGGDLGFTLSVFSTLGILLLGRKISSGLLRPFKDRPRLRGILSPAAGSLGMTFAALLFTLPIQVLVFQGTSLLAPIATLLLVLPCTLLVYSSLAASFLGLLPFLAPISEPFFFCAGWLSRLSMGIAEALARLPGTFLDLSQPVWIAVLMGAAALAVLLYRKRDQKPAVCAALCGLLLLPICGWPLEGAAERGAVTLAAAPGTSCVILMQDGKAAVLSLGGYRTDAAEALLSRNNIREVESLFLPVEDSGAEEAASFILATHKTRRLILPDGACLNHSLLLAGAETSRAYLGDGGSIEVLNGVKVAASHGMKRFTITVGGFSAVVETGQTGAGRCQLLFTSLPDTGINSPFTVLQNDDIIERLKEKHGQRLPQKQYLLPDGNGLYIDLFRDGSINFRGESICLRSRNPN